MDTGVCVPAVAEFGKTLVSVGGLPARVIVNDTAPDVPPPGPGFTTVIGTEPAVVTNPGGITEVNWVELTNVVGRLIPAHVASAPGTKFVPVNVMGTAVGIPAVAEFGETAVSVGTGFPVEVIVSGSAFDGPPPGPAVVTETCTVPGLATNDAGIDAVSVVELTNVVTIGAVPNIT
jgi:hypothetical protein